MTRRLAALAAMVALGAAACAQQSDEDVGDGEGAVEIDTSSAQARAQYDANARYALEYAARCAPDPASTRRRVVIAGYGRFTTGPERAPVPVTDNASGRIVSTLVPEAIYPETRPPRRNEVDLPGPQVSVARSSIELAGYGKVDVCAMILPVSWDLSAILVAKEIEAFDPSFVMMNGVGAEKQSVWIELGAVNRANGHADASKQMRPHVETAGGTTKVIDEAPASEDIRGNLLSWAPVLASAREALERHLGDRHGGVALRTIAPSVLFPGFPRKTGMYVCNDTSYATGWLMDHAGTRVELMRASAPRAGSVNSVPFGLTTSHEQTPRVFVHWPRSLKGAHVRAAADVMGSIIAAQLRALDTGDLPTRGDPARSDPSVQGDDFF